ncbi:MAG: hotdog fold thioesterase [Roseivirga sp.]
MFQQGVTLEMINTMSKNTMVEHLDIEVIEIGEDFLKAKMPVDHRTTQPMGLLHGGASVVLAETLGSIAGTLTVNNKEQHCVGLEINANHIKSAKSGFVYGKTTPIHIGKRTQIWEITITNELEELVCVSRLTLAVIDKK